MEKLFAKSKLGIIDKQKVADTVKSVNMFDIILEAERAWSALDGFRKNYIRCRNYVYGKQWNDKIKDPKTGKTITEEQYIMDQGKVPLKQNLIRQLVKNVLGQFSSNQTEPICIASDRDEQELGEMMSIAVKYAYSINKLWDIDIRSLERFLIGAVICHKVNYNYNANLNREDVIVKEVNPSRLFFDTAMEDTRLWDCDLIGELHDLTISDLISAFAEGDINRAENLREKYRCSNDLVKNAYETLTSRRIDNMDFYSPYDSTLCRVIEIWRKENKERYRCHDILKGTFYKIEKNDLLNVEKINLSRINQAKQQGMSIDEVPLIEYEWFIDRYWYARWLTPFGELLKEMETPYLHCSHPYILKLYPFIDGEVHSFVEDVIDQQRYVNRLITLLDFIMGASAKGVLLFPEDQIPEGMTIEDVADEWTKYNGVILFKPKPGAALPQQISSNSTNVGAIEMLQIQMQFINEISGVHTAIRGGEVKAGTPASLYAQQSQNSATNLIDLLDTFRSFREERDTKAMKVIQQYYKSKRYINIAGNNYSEISKNFTPEKVRDIDFDLTIKESQNTPAYRQVADEFLMQLFGSGQIPLEDFLENSSMPFSDRLLQKINAKKEEAASLQKQQMQQMEQLQMQQPEAVNTEPASNTHQTLNKLLQR